MPSRDWQLRIQDILQSIAEILQRTEGMEFEDFMVNRTIIKAVLYDFGIIGEAARNIPPEIQSRYPQIPWRLMGDMRNIFHEYFQVELEIIWRAIKNNLPLLALQLQEVLESE
ncbi:HepT-like ribonuclease domain-containing protein [Coleofasciculus sp. D1-CHI-01]|uniref:HepT-like ribonuclease domain-containing protein n=1 Tax=Coleofasciculus sp. D1-CHI-01 TaxID=3068482 RepID=UPI004063643E